jgi:hypothetical protein
MMRLTVVMPGLVPGIHVFVCLAHAKTGMPGAQASLRSLRKTGCQGRP